MTTRELIEALRAMDPVGDRPMVLLVGYAGLSATPVYTPTLEARLVESPYGGEWLAIATSQCRSDQHNYELRECPDCLIDMGANIPPPGPWRRFPTAPLSEEAIRQLEFLRELQEQTTE